MKVDVEKEGYEYDKSIYVEPTKLEKKTLNEENKYFGVFKLKAKNELLKNLSKDIKNKRYILNTSRLQNVSKSLYDELNNLNLSLYLNVLQDTYKRKYKELEKDVDDDKVEDKMPNEKTLNKWLGEFFSGDGINYIYLQEILRRRDYFNSQMTNAIMNDVNNKISNELSKKDNKIKTNSDIEKFVKDNISMNSNDILKEIKKHKKSWGQLTDDTMAILINKTVLEVYNELGVKKVVRVAIIDDRTCNECVKLNGTVYDIDNIPKLIIHRNDRCTYQIYKG